MRWWEIEDFDDCDLFDPVRVERSPKVEDTEAAVFEAICHSASPGPFVIDDQAGGEGVVVASLPDGRLIVVDFAPHRFDHVSLDHAHHWLGFADEEVSGWCEDAGLFGVRTTHLVHTSEALTEGHGEDSLTVTLWVATQRSDAPALYNLEVAS